MDEQGDKCPTCNNFVKNTWKYCRHCGEKVVEKSEVIDEVVDESVMDDLESMHEVSSEPEFDRELYYQVLSSREKRGRLSKEKKKLKEDIATLLTQLKSKLITRDYATPKIAELKSRTQSVNDKLSDFKELPTELPLEVLNDEIDSVKITIRKLDKLKSDESISKSAIKAEKEKAKETLLMLEDQKSRVSGHVRNWLADLNSELDSERKDFDSLNIKFKIQEITEDTFKERKEKVVDKIEELDNVTSMVDRLIQ